MMFQPRVLLQHVLLLLLLLWLLSNPASTATGNNNGKNNNDNRREDVQAERALNRTMSKLLTDGEHGRFVLLMCRAKCLRERAQIPSWLREFNTANNFSLQQRRNAASADANATTNASASNDAYDAVGFHFHFHRRPMPVEDIEQALREAKAQIMVFYVVGGRAFPLMPGSGTMDKSRFLAWLDTFERPPIVRIGDGEELDEWLNSECHGSELRRRREERQMILLVVHDLELCPETLLPNIARSLAAPSRLTSLASSDAPGRQRPTTTLAPLASSNNFTVLELLRPLAEELELSLYARLRGLAHTCRMDILMRANLFTELPLGVLGSHIHGIADNWQRLPLASERCPEGNASLNLARIQAPLGPASLEFMCEERILKAIERKREYLTVGIIGGVAVMALAMSIFWGLNGNDFVPKQ